MSTGPRDRIPSYRSAGEADELMNVRNQCRTERSSASDGPTISNNEAPSAKASPSLIIASTPSCSSRVDPHG